MVNAIVAIGIFLAIGAAIFYFNNRADKNTGPGAEGPAGNLPGTNPK